MTWWAQIIAGTCAAREGCCYVEVGVDTGQCIRTAARACGEVHGVDVQDCSDFMPAGSKFWHMRSDDFWDRYDGTRPDVIFIDGLHEYEQATRDYEGARRLLAPDGLILLHDTWPGDEANMVPELCGDVYRLREDIESNCVSSFTYRQFPGLTVVSC